MKRRRFLWLYAAAWLPLAILYAALQRAQGLRFADAIWSAVLSVGVAALMGLGVWRVSEMIPWSDHGGRARFFALHIALATLYAALWTGAIAIEIGVFAPVALDRYLAQAAGWQGLTGIVMYGAIAGVAYAVRVAERLREQRAVTARAEALRVRAELVALQVQLQPHFLFNTLHSITSLVRTDPATAEQALERLGELLRYVLDVSRLEREEVSLEDEWHFVQNYLAIEQMRLGGRLHVTEDVDPDALDCAVLALTLQPLVENAIRHGIAPRARGGTVRLMARMADDRLVLEVGDDGDGAPANVAQSASGLGLAAVRQRLEMHYDGRVAMDVTTAPGQGFVVRLSLPAEPAPHPAGAVLTAAER